MSAGSDAAAPAPLSAANVITRVMVVLQDDEHCHAAVREGVALASAHGADVIFVDTPDKEIGLTEGLALLPQVVEQVSNDVRSLAQRRQSSALDAARKQGVAARSLSVASPHFIAEAAVSQGCDIIVVANPGRNALVRMLTGSIVPLLVTEASVPVLICGRPPAQPLR